jgi:putative spermidine/putrescine transport system ATP-binding protein
VSKADRKRRVAEAIALVKLEEHAKKLPGQLSGGQQQRVAIARAVVLEPSLVLMDEPLSNLDAKLRLEMRTEIRRLHQSLGLTTVYVTHDQEEALSMADRLVVLRLGHVQQIGSPQELHSHPANYYVADFMGYRNILAMTTTRVAGQAVGVAGAGIELAGTSVGAGFRAGQPVRVALRPDDLRLVDHPGPDSFPATIEVAEYHGSTFALEAVTDTGQRLHLVADHGVAPGQPVHLRVDPARVLVYPVDPDDAAAQDQP